MYIRLAQKRARPHLFGPVLLLLLASFSHALIVIDGKIVTAWPDTGLGSMPTVGSSGLAKPAADTTPNIGLYPHPKGLVRGLTLVVDFSDQSAAFSKAQVDDWLNLKGFNLNGMKGSVRDYYADISNGQVDFVNDVHGIYRAKQPKSYYEGGQGYARGDEFVAEVLAAFDAEVDFSQYDNDKDGRTESISIVYAGTGQTWGQGLWPHAGGLNQKRDGVTISRYMMTDMGTRYSLYVFCHECGHMLFGWPDLYGVGDYCLMGNRMHETNPVPVNDFYRADQGWIPLTDIRAADDLRLTAIPNGTGFRFQNPARSQECFFWSNVANTGRWSFLKGRGILLWHFDKSIGNNDPPKPLSLAVVQADGKKQLDTTYWPSPGSDAQDFFFGGHTDHFDAAGAPKAAWNNGQAADLKIYSIAPISDAMEFFVGKNPPSDIHSGNLRRSPWRKAFPYGDAHSPRDLLGRRLAEPDLEIGAKVIGKSDR